MNKSKFQFVVQTVEKVRYDYVIVTGIVEGSSISLNDYLCLTTQQGKKIRARVEEIVVDPQLNIRTAEPGRMVYLLLCGSKVKWIKQGDVLKKPTNGIQRISGNVQIFLLTFIIFVAIYLLYSISALLLWGEILDIDFLKRMLSVVMANFVPFSGMLILDTLSKRKWKRVQQRDDLYTEIRVLKCSPLAYLQLMVSIFLIVIMSVFFYQWSVEESDTLQKFLESEEWKKVFFFLSGINLFLIGNFLYLNCRKVFYSKYLFRMVSFGKAHDISWTQVCSMLIIREKKRSKCILKTAENQIVLCSNILVDGWGDFVDFALNVAKERNIPYQIYSDIKKKKKRVKK